MQPGVSRQQEEAAFYQLSIAGTQCHAVYHADYGGEPLVWGGDHKTASAAECCAACQAHRDTAARGSLNGKDSVVCNIWVHCSDKQLCGAQWGDCWLKHQDLQVSALPPMLLRLLSSNKKGGM